MTSHRISTRLTLALAGLLAAAAFALTTTTAHAQPGALDPTFGSGGLVLSDLDTVKGSSIEDVKVQSDGKIVALEHGYSNANHLLRYLPDGTPDPSFGNGGVAPVPSSISGRRLALQADGKILLGGFATGHFAVARFLSDGELDQDFDGDSGNANGVVTTTMSAVGQDLGTAITVDSKGRIVLAGRAQLVNGKSDFGIARYLPDGKLDQAFAGGGGRLVEATAADDSIWAVTTQDDGKIVAGGSTGSYPDVDTVVARYNDNGFPDSTFGSSGRKQIDFGGWDIAAAVALQSSDQPLVAVHTEGDDKVIRLTDGGDLDASFAGNNAPVGLKVVSMAIAPDGKIALGGAGQLDGDNVLAVARRDADGSPDASFANGAQVLTRVAPGEQSDAGSVAVASDGKIVAGGSTGAYPDSRGVVARFQVDPDPAPAGGTTGGSTAGGGAQGGGTTGGSTARGGAQDAGSQPQSAPSQPDALTLSGLAVTNRRFAIKPTMTPRVGQAQAARRTKRGTAFTFTLNRAAAVAIRIDRLAKAKGAKARVAARLKRAAAAGANRVAFSGHVGRRVLRPGRYRATFTAVDAAGSRSTAQALTFRIVAR
jgi:uncharacterized delta-60 repeat protein